MKNISFILFALFVLAAGNSCKKEGYTCSHSISYEFVQVSFTGFSPQQLSEVILDRYQRNSNFSTRTGSDTIDASGAVFKGDTAYFAIKPNSLAGRDYYEGFLDVRDDADYKITVPATGESYTITAGTGALSETWEQDTECSSGSTQSRIVPYNIMLNGNAYEPFFANIHNYLIFLSR